jgi:hypothetical protein
MSILLLAHLLAAPIHAADATSAVVVDRSKEYRHDQRPYKYYKAMKATWSVGQVMAVAGPPLALAGYFVTQGSFNRDPSVETGGETAGYYVGSVGFDLALAAPPIMLFGSLSAIPALKKTGLRPKPTMGLVSAGLWVASVGLYSATLSSFDSNPDSTQWKALGVGGSVAWLGSAFFANSQIANTRRAGRATTGN